MNQIKVVIPARYESTRLPGKPLLEICGKPIIYHVVQQCLSAGVDLSDVIVATDDFKIYDALKFYSIPVSMTSSNHQSGTDRIYEVASAEGWSDEVIVINVQGDEPLIPSKLINDLIDFSLSNLSFPIATVVTKINNIKDFNNPNVVKAIFSESNQALHFTRSPSPINRENPLDLTLAFRHIGIYSYSVAALKAFCNYPEASLEKYEKLEQLRALSYGIPIGVCIYDGDTSHGVDTQDDFQLIKSIMEKSR